MDIFKFRNPTVKTKMEQGEIINGLRSKMWIERYDEFGEFTLVGKLRNGIKEKLPIGTFISHVDTKEIMVVKDHEIKEDKGTEPEIIVTGQSYESFLDDRLIGNNKSFPITSGVLYDFTTLGANPGSTVRTIIRASMHSSVVVDAGNAIPWLEVHNLDPTAGTWIVRRFERGPLYQTIKEIMDASKLGMKIHRPGPWKYSGADGVSELFIYHGENKANSVVFAYSAGEIESADYFWSSRESKNYAYVAGKWIHILVVPPETGIDRRMLYVDASGIDNGYNSAPTGGDQTEIIDNMTQMGLDAIDRHRETAIANVEISKGGTRYKYREDFNIGDIVAVNGNYNQSTTMRVSEYVEIEDENGRHGYPTLVEV